MSAKGPGDAELYRMALRNAADRRVRAKEMHDGAQRTIRTVVPRAKEAGVSVPEIADILGVTRQGVYFLLR